MMMSKPNGSRVQRAKRRAQERARGLETFVRSVVRGREQAVTALVEHARNRAIPKRMPSGLRTVRTLVDRAREWTLNTAATLVARHIERATFKVAFERRKLSFEDFVAAMRKGRTLNKIARG